MEWSHLTIIALHFLLFGFLMPGCPCCTTPTCNSCQSGWPSMAGSSIDDAGIGGCGWAETAGAWQIVGSPNGWLQTESDNAVALSAFVPGAIGFYLSVSFFAESGPGTGTPGDIVRFWIDHPDTYCEVRIHNGSDIAGYMKIIDGGVTVAELTGLDFSGTTVYEAQICVTNSSIRFGTNLGCIVAQGLSLSGFVWGLGTGAITGTASTGTQFDNVYIQDNGVDGSGNPCGCTISCEECKDEYRIDMSGWATEVFASVSCDDLNTSVYVRRNCNENPQTACGEAVSCLWSGFVSTTLNDFEHLQFGATSIMVDVFVAADPLSGFLDPYSSWRFCKTTGFTRSTDCNTIADAALTLTSTNIPDPDVNVCIGASVVLDVTAV